MLLCRRLAGIYTKTWMTNKEALGNLLNNKQPEKVLNNAVIFYNL